jgi:hypothetical protein
MKFDYLAMKTVFIAVIFSCMGRNEGYGLSKIKIKSSLSAQTLLCKRSYIVNQGDIGAYRSLSTLYGCLQDDIEDKSINIGRQKSFRNKLKVFTSNMINIKNNIINLKSNSLENGNKINTIENNRKSTIKVMKRFLVVSLSIYWSFIMEKKACLAKGSIAKGTYIYIYICS